MGYRVNLGGFEDYESPTYQAFSRAHADLAKKYDRVHRGSLKDLWPTEYGGTVITKIINGYERWVGVEFDSEEDYFLFLLKTVR